MSDASILVNNLQHAQEGFTEKKVDQPGIVAIISWTVLKSFDAWKRMLLTSFSEYLLFDNLILPFFNKVEE